MYLIDDTATGATLNTLLIFLIFLRRTSGFHYGQVVL